MGAPEQREGRGTMGVSRSAEDWEHLFAEVTEAFSPGAPIRERDLFSGRLDQIRMLVDAVRQRGRHAIIFGERGVGKTSLANTFALGIHSSTSLLIAEKVNADPNDDFTSLWKKIFKRLAYRIHENGIDVMRRVSDDYSSEITPDDVQIEMQSFSINSSPIMILDEFDRVQDPTVSLLVADTIKALSDYSVNATVVVVGVADNIANLIRNHQSISRQLIQVQMPRMNREELSYIITSRLKRVGMTIDEETLWRATFLSRGLPYFTHLLGMHSARSAINKKRLKVGAKDLEEGIRYALVEIDQSLKEKYNHAILSQKPKETLYEPVLLACALADSDELGRFQQKSVEDPLAAIMPGRKYKATTYAFHMNEFCEEKRGRILEKLGEEGNPRYRFANPLMQPYVILKGLSDGRINKQVSDRFLPARQLPISKDFL